MKTATALPLQKWFKDGIDDLMRPGRIQVEEIADPERPLEIRRFVRRLRENREFTFTADFVR